MLVLLFHYCYVYYTTEKHRKVSVFKNTLIYCMCTFLLDNKNKLRKICYINNVSIFWLIRKFY